MFRFYLSIGLLFISIIVNAQWFVTTQDVKVRKGAGTKYDAIGILSSGTKVEVLEEKGKWGRINFEREVGYVSTKYLQVTISPETATSNAMDTGGSSNGVSSIFKWIIGGVIVVVLFKIFGFKKIYSTVLPEQAEILLGKYECTKCGRTTIGRDKKNCPNGGLHTWYKV